MGNTPPCAKYKLRTVNKLFFAKINAKNFSKIFQVKY